MPSITKPTKAGFAFGGYYTSASGSGTQYYTSTGASARTWDKTTATTLYAKWTANTYTVTLHPQGGTGGSASVTAVDGTGATALYFANGANWAGTVVAGNVALTNLTDGAAAATATFGSLDLAADFPIRVWKSEGAYSADAINVGSFINNGGKIWMAKKAG